MDRLVHVLRKNALHLETLIESAVSSSSGVIEHEDNVDRCRDVWNALCAMHCTMEELTVS